MRGAVNLVELIIPTTAVTLRTFGRNLIGINKEWCHVPDLVIISLACIDRSAAICIVLKNSNAANCRLKKVGEIHNNVRIFYRRITHGKNAVIDDSNYRLFLYLDKKDEIYHYSSKERGRV
jgi:hypothetical protein